MELPCCKNGVCPQSGPPPEGEIIRNAEEGRAEDDGQGPSDLNPVDRHLRLLGVLHQLPWIGLLVEFIFCKLLSI